MKTKIVYTTLTDDSDIYLEQLLVSLVSLKHHSPDAHVVLVTDNKSKATMTGNRAKVLEYINELIVPEIPENFSKVMRSRYLKTNLREYITGDFLYIDTDTVIASPLEEIDELTTQGGGLQLAGVNDCNIPLTESIENLNIAIKRRGYDFALDTSIDKAYFNSGVIFAADTPEVHNFYSAWNKNWMDLSQKTGLHLDQIPLAFTNRNFPSLMSVLGNEWNCQVMATEGGLGCLYKAKIVHYWTGVAGERDYPYIFRIPNIWKRIKNEGSIPDDIMPYVFEPRSAFLPYTQVIMASEFKALSVFDYMFLHYPKGFAFARFLARACMFFPNRIRWLFEKK